MRESTRLYTVLEVYTVDYAKSEHTLRNYNFQYKLFKLMIYAQKYCLNKIHNFGIKILVFHPVFSKLYAIEFAYTTLFNLY
jgi:hypothetical protein